MESQSQGPQAVLSCLPFPECSMAAGLPEKRSRDGRQFQAVCLYLPGLGFPGCPATTGQANSRWEAVKAACLFLPRLGFLRLTAADGLLEKPMGGGGRGFQLPPSPCPGSTVAHLREVKGTSFKNFPSRSQVLTAAEHLGKRGAPLCSCSMSGEAKGNCLKSFLPLPGVFSHSSILWEGKGSSLKCSRQDHQIWGLCSAFKHASPPKISFV